LRHTIVAHACLKKLSRLFFNIIEYLNSSEPFVAGRYDLP